MPCRLSAALCRVSSGRRLCDCRELSIDALRDWAGAKKDVDQTDLGPCTSSVQGNPILRSHQSGLGTTHSHNAGHGHHGHSFGPLSDSSPQRGNVVRPTCRPPLFCLRVVALSTFYVLRKFSSFQGTHLSRHLEQLAFTQRTLHQHPVRRLLLFWNVQDHHCFGEPCTGFCQHGRRSSILWHHTGDAD